MVKLILFVLFSLLVVVAAVSAAEAPPDCTLPTLSQADGAAVLPWDQADQTGMSPVKSPLAGVELLSDCPEDPPGCCRWGVAGDCFYCIMVCG